MALLGGLIIGLIMALMTAVKVRQSAPYLLILHYNEAVSQQVTALIKKLPGARLKSKTVQRDAIELTVELRLRSEETGFVEKFLRLDGVYDASLISHQGDIVS